MEGRKIKKQKKRRLAKMRFKKKCCGTCWLSFYISVFRPSMSPSFLVFFCVAAFYVTFFSCIFLFVCLPCQLLSSSFFDRKRNDVCEILFSAFSALNVSLPKKSILDAPKIIKIRRREEFVKTSKKKLQDGSAVFWGRQDAVPEATPIQLSLCFLHD